MSSKLARFSVIALLLLLAAALAACAPATPTPAPVTKLTFTYWGSDMEKAALEEMVAAFEAKNSTDTSGKHPGETGFDPAKLAAFGAAFDKTYIEARRLESVGAITHATRDFEARLADVRGVFADLVRTSKLRSPAR